MIATHVGFDRDEDNAMVTKAVFHWSSSTIGCWKKLLVKSRDEKTTAPPMANRIVFCFGSG